MKIIAFILAVFTLTVSAEDNEKGPSTDSTGSTSSPQASSPQASSPQAELRAGKTGAPIDNAQGRHLFILSGQSNMACLKSDRLFNPIVEKAFGKENVIVVRYARSGQPIRKWFSLQKDPKTDKAIGGHNIYDGMMTAVKEEVKDQKLATVTFIWMQGETDAGEKKDDVYEACLKGLLAEVKKDMGLETLNFVVGRICDWQKKVDDPHWKKVREIQVKVAESDPNGAWVDTDDLNDDKMHKGKLMVNPLHYSSKGYKILGERFAEKAIELIKKQ